MKTDSHHRPGSRGMWSAFMLAALILGQGAVAGATPDFTRDVRPLLSRSCFKCHGPDDAARKGGLRLDRREAALRPAKSGAAALVPGDPEKSELVRRLFTTDADEVMPPPSTKMTLSAREKEILKEWVAAGGEYREHWAFVPPVQVPPPAVRDEAWPAGAIDRFVLARLEREGLAPSPPADRPALVRRVYQDLIGLPPTTEEADAFVHDGSPGAYERLVDGLLASPHYGERWARRWLDLARYADTNGYEKDRQRSIWPWRDWVIGALNADLPFDRFTIEQIAGDLLPGATVDQIVATGFHRNTMLNEEGGIDPLEFRFHAMTDRVSTTGTTWLGLTLSCAQCHTHKYDPIPQREYYQVMAFLNNADEPDLDLPRPEAEAKREADLARAAKLLAELPGRYPIESNRWETPRPVRVEAAGGGNARLLDDGSALFAGPGSDRDTYTFVIDTDRTNITTLRLEALVDDALPSRGPGRVQHGNFVLSELTVTAAPRSEPERSAPVGIVRATADAEQSGFPVTAAVDGKPDTGWAIDIGGGKLNTARTALFTLEKPVGYAGGTRFVVRLEQQHGGRHTLGRPRLSLGAPAPGEGPVEARRAEALERDFAAWLVRERAATAPWTTLRPRAATSNLPLLTVEPDGSVFASGDISKSDLYTLKFDAPGERVTAIRLEALPDERLPRHGPGMAYYEGPKGDFFMGEFQVLAGGRPVRFAGASESYAKNNFGAQAGAALATDGDPQTGWSTAGREGERHEAVFLPAEPIAAGEPLEIRMMFGRHYASSLGRFRLSVTSRPDGAVARDLPAGVEDLLRIPDERLTEVQRESLREQFLLSHPAFANVAKEIRQLRKPPVHPTTLVLRERPPGNPRATFVHRRGEFLQPGDRVEPGVLTAIAPFPDDFPTNRLGFARWLVSTNNPLTARVTVNRQWQAFFGRGLVKTLEDFGFQGEAPSHLELLDWLAVEFMRTGWSMKRLHRSIVLSATYRQSSRVTAEMAARDPENRLLARGPRGRLEAEIIRDGALRAAGLLSTKRGGPSVYPPQPAGVTETAYGGAGWTASTGEDRHRRSLYTFSKRTAPFALFNTFDGPTGESCVARRDVSNTPLQALTLLNDVFVVEASQALGTMLANRPESVEDRVRHAFRRCLTRPPSESETATLAAFFEAQRRRFAGGELDPTAVAGGGPGDVVERAAWTAVARALLNLDEMITKS